MKDQVEEAEVELATVRLAIVQEFAEAGLFAAVKAEAHKFPAKA